MGKLWILYDSKYDVKGENDATKMLKTALDLKIDAELVFYQYFTIKETFIFYKDVLIKQFPAMILIRRKCLELMKILEKNNVKTINGFNAMKIASDKWKTYCKANSLNIKQPKTILIKGKSFYSLVQDIGIPFVLKDRFGSKGKSVHLIKNEKQYLNIKNKYKEENLIGQEYISSSHGRSIRIYYIFGKIIGAVKFVSKTSFQSNYHLGSGYKVYEIKDKALEQEVKMIADNIQGNILGFDYLFTKDSLVFCEVNSIAGFKPFNQLGLPMREYMLFPIKKRLEEKEI